MMSFEEERKVFRSLFVPGSYIVAPKDRFVIALGCNVFFELWNNWYA